MKRRVVITEPMNEVAMEILQTEAEVIYLPALPGRTLLDEIAQASAIAVRTTKVDENLISQGKNLLVIAKHGVGYDNIDIDSATQKRIPVVYTPEPTTEPVAEHILGLMLCLAKKICISDRELRQGKFQSREKYTGVELKDKRLGLIGLGRIGLETARKCKTAFSMDIIVFDPYIPRKKTDQLGYSRAERLDDLLRVSDWVIVCVPLTKETANLIGERELNCMKASAFLVNTSRGSIIDENALYDSLVHERIAGAALDVFSQEPPPPQNPLLSLSNFIATPHIAGTSAEAMRRIASTLAEDILRVFHGDKPKYLINPEVYLAE